MYEICSSDKENESDEENFTLQLEDDPVEGKRSYINDIYKLNRRGLNLIHENKKRESLNGEKKCQYHCPRCGNVCSTSYTLKRHEKFYCFHSILQTNSGRCIHCGQIFESRITLIRHLLSVHQETWTG